MKLLGLSFAAAVLAADPSIFKAANAAEAQKGSNKLKRLGVKTTARMPKKAKSAKGPPEFRTVYTMNNGVGTEWNNEVIIYSADAETGELTLIGREPTNGKGGGFLGGFFLDSTDPLIVADNCLFAVNFNTNDVSSFMIHPENGMLSFASVVSSGGTGPVSVAWRGTQVFVLNTGGSGSIQEYMLHRENCAISRRGGPIELDREPDLVNTPLRPGNISPAQIGFTPDGKILVLVKATTGSGEGSFNVYEFDEAGIDPDSLQQISIPGENAVPYAFTFLADGRLIVPFAAGGPDSPQGGIDGQGGPTGQMGLFSAEYHLHDLVSTGQFASCWLAYNPHTNTAYTTNTPVGTISTVTVGEELEPAEAIAAQQPGPVDLLVSPDDKYLYTSGCAGVSPSMYVYATNGQGLDFVQSTSPEDVVCSLGLAQYVGSGAKGSVSAETA